MKKIVIIIPVYNDWESLKKLLQDIDEIIVNIKDAKFSGIIINDASTFSAKEITKPKNFTFLKIIELKDNQGHARCNALGLRYVSRNEKFDHVILMDGDGEDRPVEIKDLIEKAFQSKDISVVAKRIKRSEGPIFQFLYEAHKILTLIFTGKKINFGNYTCLTPNDVKLLSSKSSIWNSFSGSLKKHIKNYQEINSKRGLRYFGPSKMSLFKLGIHSFAIIAVFKYSVYLRSLLLITCLFFSKNILGVYWVAMSLILITFNICIFLVSLREDQKALENSENNVKSIISL